MPFDINVMYQCAFKKGGTPRVFFALGNFVTSIVSIRSRLSTDGFAVLIQSNGSNYRTPFGFIAATSLTDHSENAKATGEAEGTHNTSEVTYDSNPITLAG
jgi:hypothetical protein